MCEDGPSRAARQNTNPILQISFIRSPTLTSTLLGDDRSIHLQSLQAFSNNQPVSQPTRLVFRMVVFEDQGLVLC